MIEAPWLALFSIATEVLCVFAGLMNNEFAGTEGWACPCTLQPGGCAAPNCTISGDDVLTTYDMFHRNKCES